MRIKNSIFGLGVTAWLLCVIAFPVSAMAAVPAGTATSIEELPSPSQRLASAGASAEFSPIHLAGTAGAFLAVGVTIAMVAQRRRWGTIDLRDSCVDLRDMASASAQTLEQEPSAAHEAESR